MKQFLRHIFLILALFMATTSAWAECYAFEDPAEYSKKLDKSQTYNLGGKPGAILSFEAKKRSLGTGNLRVDQYVNGKWEEGIWKDGLTTSWKEYKNISISRYATDIRLYNTGTLAKDFKNVKITWASYVDAPQGFTNNAWPAGTDIVGRSAQKTATIAWSDATFTWELLNNTDNQFSASFSSTGATCTYGTSNITVTYLRTKPGNHSATLKITASTGATYTIALSGVTGKYIPQAAKKMDMVMNESYNPSDIFDVYYFANNVKNTISDYTIKALDPTIANYVGGKIVTNYQTGTARFQLTREADTNFDALSTTISVNVNPAGGCYAIYNEGTGSDIAGSNGAVSEAFTLTGAGDVLTFKYKLNSSTGDATWMHYVTPQYSEEESGNNFDYIYDANGNVYREETKSMSYKTSSSIPIPINAKRIRFERTANGTGGRTVKISEIYVTRKQQIAPQLVSNSLSLPQATSGRPVSASFDLSWSTCSDEIVLVSTNSNFVLNQYSIDATSGRGTNNITVTYDANSGSQSGSIIIYDQSQKIEIPVSCKVKAKLATEIIYTGEATYPDTPDGILYPFYVKDENGNTVTGATITLETSNEDILSFDADKIYPHCGGNVTLTANYAGDETHEPASKEHTIFVPECYQYIVWNQDLRGFLTDDNGTINETVELTAYAATESGVKTGTPVVYSLDTEAEKIAKLIDNHNGTYSLNVFGKGEGTITASISEYTFDGEQYYPNDYTRVIRVHKKGDPCEPYSLSDENEYAISMWNTTKILLLEGLPENTMTIMAHASVSSYENDLTVDFSTEETGDNWIGKQTQNIHSGSKNEKYTFSVPEKAKRVRFKSWSTINTYFHNTYIRQKTYLTPSVTGININSIVNQEYSYSFDLEYSNMPFVQYSVTNNHNLGFLITPGNEDINTFCDDSGTIHFTITGMSLIPHEALTETLTITTSAGDLIEIPITIDAKLLDTYYFIQPDGNWSDLANWMVNGSTPASIPTSSNPVVILGRVTIDNQAVAYSINVQEDGYVNIASSGGLTVHAGGYTSANQEEDLEITIDKNSAGYFRMYPNALLARTSANMPQAKVNFTTRGNMNDGGNKDAAWQYIGAPGNGVGMDLAHTTVLYLRSEEKGWVRQYTEWAQLTPFAGYALSQKEQETFTLYPQLLNENVTIPLTYTSNGMKGDNLWANSYMAPLDITKFSPGDFTGNVDYTFYLYNSGSWNAWNSDQSSTDDASDFTPGRYYAINFAKIDATKDQTVIPPMQGVYMKAGEGGGTLTINYEKHVWNNSQTSKMNTSLRIAPQSEENQSADFQRVRLQINSFNSGADRLYVIQDTSATSGYDNGYDASKQMADGLMNIYTTELFGKMEISSTDHMDGMYIGFEAGEDSDYTMTFSSLVGDSLYLYDLEQDSIIKMVNDEQYQFIAEPNSTNDLRFQILVAPELPEEDYDQGDVTTNLDNVSLSNVWMSDGKLYVTNTQKNSTVSMYTISGMMVVAPYTISHVPCTVNLTQLPTGVYVLRLNDQAYKFVCE